MTDKLKEIIRVTLNKMNIEIQTEDIMVEIPKNFKNGDYSSNIAMKLAHTLKKNPVVIANDIVKNIEDDRIENVEVANPGFINFYLKKDYLFENINTILEKKEDYGRLTIGNHKQVNIEFVSANPTGTLHIGHGRGAVYGSSLANILEFAGFDVTREYYVNDAGNQIQNLNRSIKIRYHNLCGKKEELDANCYHGKEIIEIAQNIYNQYGVNASDDVICEYGMKYLLKNIKQDLDEFRVYFDVWTSEKSIYQKNLVSETLNSLNKNGYTYMREDATWLKTTMFGDDKDRVLVKSDGTNTYLLPDIAYHLDKYKRGYDYLIDVLGADHHGYITRLKSGIHMMGEDENKLTIKILQMVKLLKDGEEVKLSKRTGKTITLKELIEEVGVDATRYFFANKSLDTQLDFDITLATSKSNENPVYYIQYAYARIASILRDYKKNIAIIKKYDTINSECAYNLLAKLYEFPNIVKLASQKYAPQIITNYVYELANCFHVFYNFEKVLTEDEKRTSERIHLIKATSIVIKNSLRLLSIETKDKM